MCWEKSKPGFKSTSRLELGLASHSVKRRVPCAKLPVGFPFGHLPHSVSDLLRRSFP